MHGESPASSSTKTPAGCAWCCFAMLTIWRAVSQLTARLALGHMIMPMKSAPARAATSASSGLVTPQIFTSVDLVDEC